jgi:DNA (cytosine-5)-methyltransferase 1
VILIAWKDCLTFKPSIKVRQFRTLAETIVGVEGTANHEPKVLAKGSIEMEVASHIAPGQKLCNVRAGSASIHTWDIPDVYGEVTASEKEMLETIMRLRRRFRVRDFGDADPVSPDALEIELRRKVIREVNRLVKKGYLRWVDNYIDLTNTFNGKYRRAHPGGASYTVDTKFGDPRYFLHPYEHRGFSVREAARIQGFPDEYIFHGSTSEQFRLVGNAVPPTMGFAIGEMIKGAFKG